jgi:hypothetical protein
MFMKIKPVFNYFLALLLFAVFSSIFAVRVGAQTERTFSGTITTLQFELVPNVSIEIETSGGVISVTSDAEGAFFTSSAARIAFRQIFRQKHRAANANFRRDRQS